jgi:hypothetical protein
MIALRRVRTQYTKLHPTLITTMDRAHYCEQLTAALKQPIIDVAAKYNGFSTFPAQELIYTPPLR